MDLTTLTPSTQFTTVSTLFGPYSASDLAVMPGNSSALATVGYANGIQIWDVTNTRATARPPTNTMANDVHEGSVLAWGSLTNLYSNDQGLSPSSFHRFVVGNTSFAETDSTDLEAVDGKITLLRRLGLHRWWGRGRSVLGSAGCAKARRQDCESWRWFQRCRRNHQSGFLSNTWVTLTDQLRLVEQDTVCRQELA
jgi:hypothetical protein